MGDDEDMAYQDVKCPVCGSPDSCEHLLLNVDRTFGQSTGGALYKTFESYVRAHWLAGRTEEEADEADDWLEHFEEALDFVDDLSDRGPIGSFEDGQPRMSSEYSTFYCSTPAKVRKAVEKMEKAIKKLESEAR